MFTSVTKRSAASVSMLNVSQTSTKTRSPRPRSSIHINLNGILSQTEKSASATPFTIEMCTIPRQRFQSEIPISATTILNSKLDVDSK